MDDRIALLGANGNGKSTLAKVLSGRLKPTAGEMRRSSKLRVGYFAQHQTDELDVEGTPLSHMAHIMPMAIETKVRAHLGRFGFGQDRAEVKVGSLSGGEKARLLFALMSRDAPHVMILDEPTNHLDIDSREALIAALNTYDGAVILISHDPHLIELAADRLWLVDGGACLPFDGDMDDYRRLLLDKARVARREAKPDKGEKRDKAAERKAAAEARTQLAPLRKTAKDAESHIKHLTAELDELERQLANPSLYGGDPTKTTALQKRRGELSKALDSAESAWLDAQAAIEKMQI
jgi:ATP-binding cassette subfamily F protein 3